MGLVRENWVTVYCDDADTLGVSYGVNLQHVRPLAVEHKDLPEHEPLMKDFGKPVHKEASFQDQVNVRVKTVSWWRRDRDSNYTKSTMTLSQDDYQITFDDINGATFTVDEKTTWKSLDQENKIVLKGLKRGRFGRCSRKLKPSEDTMVDFLEWKEAVFHLLRIA